MALKCTRIIKKLCQIFSRQERGFNCLHSLLENTILVVLYLYFRELLCVIFDTLMLCEYRFKFSVLKLKVGIT